MNAEASTRPARRSHLPRRAPLPFAEKGAEGLAPEIAYAPSTLALWAPQEIALRVVSGVQSGARVTLAPGARSSIGARDAELLLRDPGVGSARCALRGAAAGVTVRALTAPVTIDGLPLEVGRRATALPGAVLRLGEVAIDVATHERGGGGADADTPAAPSVVAGDGSARRAVGETAELEDASLPTVASSAPSSAPRTLARGGAFLVALLALGALWFLGIGRTGPVAPPRPSLEAVLADPAFSDLSFERGADGVARIDGVVPDTQTLRSLEARLADSGAAHVSRVETDATLARKVIDVLRVNGAEAELLGSRGGDVTVSTALPLERDLESLRASVAQDVPALGELAFDNSPPAPEPDGNLSSRPGKRIAMVVSAAPAHLVTEDLSRYFIGSLLPSGHRVIGIEGSRVSLERDGTVTEIEF